MIKKRNREISVIDEYSDLGNPSNFLNEDEIHKLSNEELREMEDDTYFLQESAKDEISKLENIIEKLNSLIERGEDKKRYVRACLHLGREKIDIIRYFYRIFNHRYSLSTIIAPIGYWASGDEIKSIEEIARNLDYYSKCMEWLNENIDAIEVNKFRLTDELLQVANEYILPLLKTKLSEFEEYQTQF